MACTRTWCQTRCTVGVVLLRRRDDFDARCVIRVDSTGRKGKKDINPPSVQSKEATDKNENIFERGARGHLRPFSSRYRGVRRPGLSSSAISDGNAERQLYAPSNKDALGEKTGAKEESSALKDGENRRYTRVYRTALSFPLRLTFPDTSLGECISFREIRMALACANFA